MTVPGTALHMFAVDEVSMFGPFGDHAPQQACALCPFLFIISGRFSIQCSNVLRHDPQKKEHGHFMNSTIQRPMNQG
jgi:hypothetical protein